MSLFYLNLIFICLKSVDIGVCLEFTKDRASWFNLAQHEELAPASQ
jgi:hypothetical protein